MNAVVLFQLDGRCCWRNNATEGAIWANVAALGGYWLNLFRR